VPPDKRFAVKARTPWSSLASRGFGLGFRSDRITLGAVCSEFGSSAGAASFTGGSFTYRDPPVFLLRGGSIFFVGGVS
jgi:hypothetical protein